AKSPLTDRLNDALSSSHFALAAKRAGFDALVLVGACDRPSVVVIDEGRLRIESADGLGGLPAQDAEEILIGRLGSKCHWAVMGSKKVKAIAVAGSQRVEVADPAGVVAAAKDLSQRSFGPATAKYRELGTVSNLLTFNRFAALPTRNFQQGTFEGAANLSGE